MTTETEAIMGADGGIYMLGTDDTAYQDEYSESEELKLRVQILERQVEALQGELRLIKHKFRLADPTQDEYREAMERALRKILSKQDWTIRFDAQLDSLKSEPAPVPVPPSSNVEGTVSRATNPAPVARTSSSDATYDEWNNPTEIGGDDEERCAENSRNQVPLKRRRRNSARKNGDKLVPSLLDLQTDSDRERRLVGKTQSVPMLVGERHRDESIITSEQKKLGRPTDPDVTPIFFKKCESKEELLELNELVKTDIEKRQSLVELVRGIGGLDCNKSVRNAINKLMTLDVGVLFSARGAKGKDAFFDLEFKDIIIEGLKKRWDLTGIKDTDVEKELTKYLPSLQDKINYRNNPERYRKPNKTKGSRDCS